MGHTLDSTSECVGISHITVYPVDGPMISRELLKHFVDIQSVFFKDRDRWVVQSRNVQMM